MPKVSKRSGPKLEWKSGKILAAWSKEGTPCRKPNHESRDCQILGPFAVLPSVTDEDLISVSHVATGRSILVFKDPGDAVDAAELLAKHCLTKFDDVREDGSEYPGMKHLDKFPKWFWAWYVKCKREKKYHIPEDVR